MTGPLIEDMSPEEFEQALDDFISREQPEVPVSTFFETLALIDQQRQATARVIRLQTRVTGDGLEFITPTKQEDSITVEGNQIVLEDGRRIVLELEPNQAVS